MNASLIEDEAAVGVEVLILGFIGSRDAVQMGFEHLNA
jgi:hypothetical protein